MEWRIRPELFDRDGDNQVTGADLEALGRRVLTEYGLEEDSAPGQLIMDGARKFWTSWSVARDSDGNGQLNQAEVLATDSVAFEEWSKEWMNTIVTTAGLDSDGIITCTEIERLCKVFDLEPEVIGGEDFQSHLDHDVAATDDVVAIAPRLFAEPQARLGTDEDVFIDYLARLSFRDLSRQLESGSAG